MIKQFYMVLLFLKLEDQCIFFFFVFLTSQIKSKMNNLRLKKLKHLITLHFSIGKFRKFEKKIELR